MGNMSDNTIVIPELEEAALTYNRKTVWSDRDKKILKKYYGRVPTAKLATQIHRSVFAVNKMAEMLCVPANRA